MMNDELRDAVEWARKQMLQLLSESEYDGKEWRYLKALIRAAEQKRVTHTGPIECPDYGEGEEMTADTIITPEMIAELLPDWAAGMVWDAVKDRWVACSNRPENTQERHWDYTGLWLEIPLLLPAPDDRETSWTPKPKSELRCPYCGSTHVIVTTHSGQWYWSCRNVSCLWSGPLKATPEEARASAEVKPELRCPECGCDARLIESAHAGGGTYRWLCKNDGCGARGGRKPTKAEARASAEVKR